ncbi:DUF7693 family protein [Pseudomonas tolaasii]|uniref:DUF7693 family protein n=2 Tax=Pseudomonas tolaasii TaxID=29442 RepID=UPI003F882BFD
MVFGGMWQRGVPSSLSRLTRPRAQTTLNTTPLTAREVCQVLTDVALGKRIMMRSSIQSWGEIYHGLMPVEIDGWRLTLFNDCDTLDYCKYCRSPDGRVSSHRRA